MLAIKVTVDQRSFKEAAYILRAVPRAVPRVFRRAIKSAVDKTATDLKNRVGAQITAKKGAIAKGISKKKSTFYGSVGVETFRLGLLAFLRTEEKKPHGVSYRISKTAGRKRIGHGFIATMPSGHRGVFARGRETRLPIGEIRGPSVWKVVTDTAGLLKAVTDAAGARLGKLINDQIGVEFRRWSR
ncbi:MAG: phage tail protein [Desulfobacteraceae bacterium]|nr:phage tail protein [Desulfobacteraceae bacterium]